MARFYRLKVNQLAENAIIADAGNISLLEPDDMAVWVGDNIASHRRGEVNTTIMACANALREESVPAVAALSARVAEVTLEGLGRVSVSDVLVAGAPLGGEDVVAVMYGDTAINPGSSDLMIVTAEGLADAHLSDTVAA